MKILHQSSWAGDNKLRSFPKLQDNLEADVVIIGGGMAGILSAYVLAKAGKSIVILEANRLLSGATSLTTAFLTQVLDTSISDLISMYGVKKTKLIWESHGQAIDFLEKIAEAENLECEFARCSNYSYANRQDDFESLREEYKAMKELGFRAALKKNNDLKFKNYGYIETKNQAKFHPLKFLGGLVPKLKAMDVRIFEKTKAGKIIGNGPVKVQAGKYSVKAQYAITATHDPLNNPIQTFMKKGMYVSYVYEVRLPKGKFKQGLYEDLENPYHYFRIDRKPNHDRMIIGGEDNRQEIEFRKQKNFNALSAYLRQLMGNTKYRIIRKWRGPILEPSDGLALIGQFKPHQLLATAFSGNGMTYSAIAAIIFRDLILKRKNNSIRLYDPKRVPTVKQLLKKGTHYGEEFIKGAVRNTIKY